MAFSPYNYDEVRQAIAAAIEPLTGFRESRFPWERYGDVPGSFADKTFAVGIPRSVPPGQREGSASDVGWLVTSRVQIAFMVSIKPKEQIPTIDEVFATEILIMRALDELLLDVRWVDSQRTLSPTGEFRVVDLAFDVNHEVS